MKSKLNEAADTSEKTGNSMSRSIKKAFLYLCMFGGVIITFFPFYYMLVLSTRSREAIFNFPPPLWFGDSFTKNLNVLLEEMPFFLNIGNTLFVSTTSTLFTLFFCSLAGYAFAKYDFKWKEQLFYIMLATMMLPKLLSIIPWFIMMRSFGWINDFKALIIPGIANPFGIFLMRQFMEKIPTDLLDSARIDGAGEFEIYWKIALPLSLPGLGTLGILTFLAKWNQFMRPLVVLQSEKMYTIQVALQKLNGKMHGDWGAMMVGTALGILPLVLAFVLASRQFISGLTQGAVKG